MSLFKNTRDTLKANGLMSHLEYAVQHFRPRDMWQCEHHVRGAQKALTKVKAAKAQYILSDDGWQYIARLAAQLHGQLQQSGLAELAKTLREIGHYACLVLGEREDPISDSELAILGPVDEDGFLIEPSPPPRVMRDPFPFPSSEVQPKEPVETPKPSAMDPLAREYFLGLLVVAKHAASRVPSLANPPGESSERAADEYVRWLARAAELKPPSPEAACAFIPRLEMVDAFGSYAEPLFQSCAQRQGIAADSSAMIEWYLITYWYEYWRHRWLAGVLADE